MSARWFGWIVLAVLASIGCARNDGAPRVAMGSPCVACGMPIRDARFACVRGSEGRYRSYDAIECLLREGPMRSGESAHLTDYDTAVLHAADSIWVVKGEFPSPMGAGLAAFFDRDAADAIATETRGRVGRLETFSGAIAAPASTLSAGQAR